MKFSNTNRIFIMDITALSPRTVWQNFAEICAIPHASGNEKQLSCFLMQKAEKMGLAVRQDAFYNLRIDRKEVLADSPRILLQAHLDMVPQVAPGKVFDFDRDPITPVIKGDFVYADGTTLGADDGIGVALALAVLADENIKGNISAVFTVNEETGLIGAGKLSPDFLEGDILINLDHGDSSKICIGCAGGIRIAFDFATGSTPAPAGKAVKITLSGLPGGHSGACIHEKRGNALQMLAEIVRNLPLAIASFDGGTVDNAIPDCAVISAVLLDDVEKILFQRSEEMKKELDERFTLDLEVETADMPETVWASGFQENFLEIFSALPNGAVDFASEYGVPRTSSNLASLKSTLGNLHLILSARSLDDKKRKQHTDLLIAQLSPLAPQVKTNSEYPGWTPDTGSELPEIVRCLRKELLGKETEIEVIHAGLEAGIFAGKNPRLKMLSISPDSFDIHTPNEHVSIPAVQEFYTILTAFLNKLV